MKNQKTVRYTVSITVSNPWWNLHRAVERFQVVEEFEYAKGVGAGASSVERNRIVATFSDEQKATELRDKLTRINLGTDNTESIVEAA